MVIGAILHTDMTVHQATVDMLVAREGFSAEPSEADRADMVNTVVHAMDLNNVAVRRSAAPARFRRFSCPTPAPIIDWPAVPAGTVGRVCQVGPPGREGVQRTGPSQSSGPHRFSGRPYYFIVAYVRNASCARRCHRSIRRRSRTC
jgi:hypothetical protein